MKRATAFTLIFSITLILITATLLYFSGLDITYASKPNVLSASWVKSIQKKLSRKPTVSRPRDIKIPDEYPLPDLYNTELNLKPIEKSPPLVVIDPGHGGNDPGAPASNLIEKDLNLDVCLRLNNILKSAGVHTYMIRTSDVFIDPKERILTANSKNATLFISIHMNWLKNPSYNGTTTLYYPSDTLKMGNLTEKNYATMIQDELMKVLETKNMGINHRDDLAVLRHATMPSVLVELGFLSNRKDAALLASDSFRQKAAVALAEGIQKALATVE